MSVITFLSFRSTFRLMDIPYLTRKRNETLILLFPSKYSFSYNLLAVIYDKKYLIRIRRNLITTSSGNDHFYIRPLNTKPIFARHCEHRKHRAKTGQYSPDLCGWCSDKKKGIFSLVFHWCLTTSTYWNFFYKYIRFLMRHKSVIFIGCQLSYEFE